MTCTSCGSNTSASYRLCARCLSEDVRAERARQGLPHREERPEILDRIARAFVVLPTAGARATDASDRIAS